MTTPWHCGAELKVEERWQEAKGVLKGKWNLGGQIAADDVYIRADCWKSTCKATDAETKETLLLIQPSTDSGRQADLN